MGIIDRRERERTERRRLIMDGARVLFNTRGFSATTMEEIAKAVELSTATLYLYFKNKEELYGSLGIRELSNLLKRLKQIGSSGELDPEKELDALKGVLFGIYENDPTLLLDVFNFQTSKLFKGMSDDLAGEIRRFSRKALRAIALIFEKGMRQGHFRQINPLALADIVWSTFSGLVIWEESKTALDSEKKFMRETFDLAFEIISEGVKLPEPKS